MPLVTAVVPVYNHEKYVIESIRSILRQTYRNIELIIINDGSRDRSHEMVLTLVEECKKRFIHFEYLNRENRGLAATLNQALSIARGKYFSALASDDIALPNKVSLLVDALESANDTCAAAFGNALFIDSEGEEIRLDSKGCIAGNAGSLSYNNFIDFYTRDRRFDYKGDEFGTYKTLIVANYLPAMSNLVRTAAISEAGGWTAGNVIEDWEMWLKLSKKYRFIYTNKPLAFYRWHDNSSVMLMGDRHKLCALLLMAKEKQFCANNNLSSSWKNTYSSLLSSVFLEKRISLSEKLSVLDFSQVSSTSLYFAKRLTRKVWRMSNSEQ